MGDTQVFAFGASKNSWWGRAWVLNVLCDSQEIKPGHLSMSEVKQRHHYIQQHPKSNAFDGLTKNILAEKNILPASAFTLDGDSGKV